MQYPNNHWWSHHSDSKLINLLHHMYNVVTSIIIVTSSVKAMVMDSVQFWTAQLRLILECCTSLPTVVILDHHDTIKLYTGLNIAQTVLKWFSLIVHKCSFVVVPALAASPPDTHLVISSCQCHTLTLFIITWGETTWIPVLATQRWGYHQGPPDSLLPTIRRPQLHPKV